MAAKLPGRLKAHQSIAWAAIAKHAEKESERTTLPVGTHDVQLEISGKAGGRPFATSIVGLLNVAPDGVRDQLEKAPVEQVVAWLLAELCEDEARRATILRKLPEVWQDQFPRLDTAAVDQAKEMLSRLRVRTGTTSQHGAVKFSPAA